MSPAGDGFLKRRLLRILVLPYLQRQDQRNSHRFIIANADTVMERDNESLLKEVFPSVPHKRSFGPHETLLANEKARKILGNKPKYSWHTKNHGS